MITDSPDVAVKDVSTGTSETLAKDASALVRRPAVSVTAGMFHQIT